MISLSPWVIQKFTDDNDNPLSLGSVHTYIAGSSTDAPSYSDVGGTLNTNPVPLDSAGEANILLSDAYVYKFVIKNASGTIVRTIDDITPSSVAGSATGANVSLDVSNFDRVLSASDTDVQKAMDTIDDGVALIGGEATQDFSAKDLDAVNIEASANLKGLTIYENGVSLVTKYAYINGGDWVDFNAGNMTVNGTLNNGGGIASTGTISGTAITASGTLLTNANIRSDINGATTETRALQMQEGGVTKGQLIKYGSTYATVAKRKHIILENEGIETIDIDELGQATVKEDATFEKDVNIDGFTAHGSGNVGLKWKEFTGTTSATGNHTITTSITKGKIVGWPTMTINLASGDDVPPNWWSQSSGDMQTNTASYKMKIDSSGDIDLSEVGTDCQSRGYTVLVAYKE